MIFRHAVGKSTLTEGFAIPKHLENWIGAPESGGKRQIVLVFEGGESRATLRRLSNARGQVQVRYDSTDGSLFRGWLSRTFKATKAEACGEYFELSKIGIDRFRVEAFPVLSQGRAKLVVAEWIFHLADERLVDENSSIREIVAIVGGVQVADGEGQSYYNRSLSQGFAAWEWSAEARVIPDLPLKCDFLKEGVQVEVEFGNARSYYQDYVKFMLAYHRHKADVGVLVVPTESLSRTLCEIGRQRAIEKGRHCYSGMIHLEKIRRELKYLDFMLQMPVAIAGIGVSL